MHLGLPGAAQVPLSVVHTSVTQSGSPDPPELDPPPEDAPPEDAPPEEDHSTPRTATLYFSPK